MYSGILFFDSYIPRFPAKHKSGTQISSRTLKIKAGTTQNCSEKVAIPCGKTVLCAKSQKLRGTNSIINPIMLTHPVHCFFSRIVR
jgi:hypothetical protein